MHDDPNSVMEQASHREQSQGYGTCSHCYAPIQDRHSGLRHFGTHTAHQEYECLRILHARIAELERERYEWARKLMALRKELGALKFPDCSSARYVKLAGKSNG